MNTYHYRRGGSDVIFMEHDAIFRGLGWDTAVFAMHHPRNEPSRWSGFFVDELEFGHRYTPWQKLKMSGKVIYSLEAQQRFTALLDGLRPDIAHAHCIYHHISPSVLPILKSRGIPVVMTAHDLKLACPSYKMLNQNGVCEQCRDGNLLHVVANRCVQGSLPVSALVAVESAIHKATGIYRNTLDRIVAPSRFFRKKLMEWGWPEEKLVYIPNFIRPGEYQPDYSAGEYFLYFGRLAPEKGLRTLVRAAMAAGVRLRIAGTGPMEDELRRLVAGCDRIELLGYLGGEELRRTIREARAVVLPSELYENAPVSVLESFASGKPVIGSRMGGIPELIREGETGWLFESGNADELAGLLGLAASTADDRIAEMGKEGRDFAVSNFNEDLYTGRMLDLYRSLGVGV